MRERERKKEKKTLFKLGKLAGGITRIFYKVESWQDLVKISNYVF